MDGLINEVKKFPELIIKLVNNLIDGAGKACSTAIGAMGFFVALLVTVDIVLKGKITIITFVIGVIKSVLMVLADVAAKGGLSLGLMAFLTVLAIAMLKKKI